MRGPQLRNPGEAIEERRIGQARPREQELGEAPDRPAEPGIRERDCPDQELREVDVGVETPGERVGTVDPERHSPDQEPECITHGGQDAPAVRLRRYTLMKYSGQSQACVQVLEL